MPVDHTPTFREAPSPAKNGPARKRPRPASRTRKALGGAARLSQQTVPTQLTEPFGDRHAAFGLQDTKLSVSQQMLSQQTVPTESSLNRPGGRHWHWGLQDTIALGSGNSRLSHQTVDRYSSPGQTRGRHAASSRSDTSNLHRDSATYQEVETNRRADSNGDARPETRRRVAKIWPQDPWT